MHAQSTNPRRILAFVLASFAACDASRPPPPGYDGPCPSPAAQMALKALAGRAWNGAPASAPGESMVFEWFAVVPNPVTGKGPIVSFARKGAHPSSSDSNSGTTERGVWFVPVLTDGDAADLVLRITGAKPEGIGGATSASYRKALRLE